MYCSLFCKPLTVNIFRSSTDTNLIEWWGNNFLLISILITEIFPAVGGSGVNVSLISRLQRLGAIKSTARQATDFFFFIAKNAGLVLLSAQLSFAAVLLRKSWVKGTKSCESSDQFANSLALISIARVVSKSHQQSLSLKRYFQNSLSLESLGSAAKPKFCIIFSLIQKDRVYTCMEDSTSIWRFALSPNIKVGHQIRNKNLRLQLAGALQIYKFTPI